MMLKLYSGSKSVVSLEASGRACATASAKSAGVAPAAPPPSHRARGEWVPQAFTGGGRRTRCGRRRVCFQLQFDPARLDEYLKDHESVWPEMQQALVDCGWHNYSLFYRRDGFAVGYFETDEDFQTACQRMEAHEVNARWQAAMSKFTPAGLSPLEGAADLCHYFYLGSDSEGADAPAAAAVAPRPASRLESLSTAAIAATAFGAGICCGLILAARSRAR
eukprot:7043328-Prymnesium_polylepis.2